MLKRGEKAGLHSCNARRDLFPVSPDKLYLTKQCSHIYKSPTHSLFWYATKTEKILDHVQIIQLLKLWGCYRLSLESLLARVRSHQLYHFTPTFWDHKDEDYTHCLAHCLHTAETLLHLILTWNNLLQNLLYQNNITTLFWKWMIKILYLVIFSPQIHVY